jgi:ABC-2 type transport system permease protein
MPDTESSRIRTLVTRELREYRNSLLLAPLAIVAVLTLVMLASVLLANRISVMGEVIMDSLVEQQQNKEVNITVHFDQDGGTITRKYRVDKQEGPIADEDWDFSREWNFNPPERPNAPPGANAGEPVRLNLIFNALHSFMLLVLVAVTINYLLGCLFNDRKDRSILFFKSMPVSEWEEVGAKLLVALVVAPAIFIAASYLLQLITAGLSILLVWRLNMDPQVAVLDKIDFPSLLVSPLASWLVTAIWVLPVYAWLLLASAGAKRSPFMLAVAPVLALVILEQIFIGSDYVASAVSLHMPHYSNSNGAVGFYFSGNEWANIQALPMLAGLVFAALALAATVWLRRYRFEL